MAAKAAAQGRSDDRHRLSARTQIVLLQIMFVTVAVVTGLVAFAVAGTGPAQLLQVVRGFLRGTSAGVRVGSWTTVLIVWPVLFLLVGGAGIWLLLWVSGRSRARHGGKGMASTKQVAGSIGEDKVRRDAVKSFPSKSAQQIANAPVESLGLACGHVLSTGQQVVFGYEEFIGIYGPSGAGKSTGLMVPAALEAPGALVMTSNEVSILDQVVAAREKLGRVWVFDPLGRSHYPYDMVWDPVAGCQRGARATGRGGAFVAGCATDDSTTTNASFFKNNAGIALRAFLHAAALDGRDISDVLQWTVELSKGARTPRNLLRESSDPRTEKMWETLLESVATGADTTVGSTRTTLAQVVEPLMQQDIMRWVLPRPGVPVFNADDFVASTDTLIIISDDTSATNVGPLCTMLFQEVVDAIKRYAPVTRHGKLELPLRIVGDEIANIAPIDKLPELCAELRKLNVHMVLAFQSDSQPIARWGQHRGAILQEQMAAEVALPGLKSTSALKRFSELAGTTDVLESNRTFDRDGEYTGSSSSMQERAVLRPHEVRTMSDGEALLVWRNMPVVKIRLEPWYVRSYAAAVTAAQETSREARRKRWQEDVAREQQLDADLELAAAQRRKLDQAGRAS